MKCEKAIDLIHYYYGEPTPLLVNLRVALHLFFCPDCAEENDRLEFSREMLKNDFFPPAPDMEESIMSRIAAEENTELETAPEPYMVPGELSTRGWVITGIVILVSLVSVFFGLEFNHLAHTAGISFMLPVGITIGIVLTSYGAFFIGSHLKELRKRFGL
jgi:hypothetical protein